MEVDKFNGTNFEKVTIQLLTNIGESLNKEVKIKELRRIEAQQEAIIKLIAMLFNKEENKK